MVKQVAQFSVKCVCRSDFQDQTYGYGVRVATPVNKSIIKGGKSPTQYRCTVCGTVHHKG